jgi:hypothetical protein
VSVLPHFFSDLCNRNRDKIKEIKEKESSFIDEVFKKYDAIKNKEHLLKLAGMVVKNEGKVVSTKQKHLWKRCLLGMRSFLAVNYAS